MNWYELKSLCIDEVAREMARKHAIGKDHNERLASWREAQKACEPDAIKAINDMSNMALIDLISEVVGSHEA